MIAPLPENETARLRALRRYRLLERPNQASFDRLTNLAAQLFSTPISLISLVDSERQFFLSHRGVDIVETSREESFCAYAIHSPEVLVVGDPVSDDRFSDNPLVLSDPHIRFYAGAPLETPDGFRLGALCVIDNQVHRAPPPYLLESLKHLAGDVIELIESYREQCLRETPPPSPKTQPLARLLLVEDDAVNQMVALAALRRLGYEVDVAANGVLALDLIKKRHYSMVLMDCQMPVMDGYTATEEIRLLEKHENRARVPIVAFTANTVSGSRERCMEAGMDDFLTKPLYLPELNSALLRWASNCLRDRRNTELVRS